MPSRSKGRAKAGGWNPNRTGDGKFTFGKSNKAVPQAQKKTTTYQSKRAEWHAKSAFTAAKKFKEAKTDADKAHYQAIAEYSAKKAKQHATAAAKLGKRHVESGSDHHKKLISDAAASNKIAQDSLSEISPKKSKSVSTTTPKSSSPSPSPKPSSVPPKIQTSTKKMEKYLAEAKTTALAANGNKAEELKAAVLNQKAAKHAKRVIEHHEKAGTTDSEEYKRAKEIHKKAKEHADGKAKSGAVGQLKKDLDTAKTPPPTPATKSPKSTQTQTHSGGEFKSMSNEAYDKSADDHASALTYKQREAFLEYSGAEYLSINGDPAAGFKGLRNPPPSSSAQEYIDHMDEAFKNPASRMQQDAILYRGAGGEAFFGKMQPGGVFDDKGFVSTSQVKTNEFYKNKPVRFHIRVPKGHPAITMGSKLSGLPGEKEILLPRGSKFKVLKVEKRDNKVYVDAEVMPHE